MPTPTLTIACRSKTGILELPYFASFTGPVQTYKSIRKCGHCYDDVAVNVLGDKSTPSISGTSTFPNFGGLGLGTLTLNWTVTLTPTTDLGDGTYLYTRGVSGSVNAPFVLGSMSLGGAGTQPNGSTEIIKHTDLGLAYNFLSFQEGHTGATWNIASIGSTLQARSPGWAFLNPVGFVNGPHQFLVNTYEWADVFNPNIYFREHAAYDFPEDCSSSFYWPPDYTTGLLPYRHVEWRPVCSGLTPQTNYTMHLIFERQLLSGGSWVTTSMTTLLIGFKAQTETQYMRFYSASNANIEANVSGTFAWRFRLSPSSFVV